MKKEFTEKLYLPDGWEAIQYATSLVLAESGFTMTDVHAVGRFAVALAQRRLEGRGYTEIRSWIPIIHRLQKEFRNKAKRDEDSLGREVYHCMIKILDLLALPPNRGGVVHTGVIRHGILSKLWAWRFGKEFRNDSRSDALPILPLRSGDHYMDVYALPTPEERSAILAQYKYRYSS